MLTVVSLAAVALAGCGVPPELRQPAQLPSPGADASPTPAPSTPPTATPPPLAPPTTAAPDLVATECRNGPSGDRVVALLRGTAGVLPRSAQVRVRRGPLCAGDWQYTVLRVTGHEELQVVTRRRPGALELVTAGTDVCTIEVRVAGPGGIRALACDGGAAGVPGA
ncbi:hypothetical protein ACFY2R_04820 [Micromonospora olivasterospora]|uniref:hypothetical protein n=1 Tax=Micromonospora olivasterospora TaxID=1880 RepID=UPI0011A0D5D2